MTDTSHFEAAIDQSHRADPYPLFAALPKTPTRLDDGRYVVTGYDDVTNLLHDARLTSVEMKDGKPTGGGEPSLLNNDPPSHDRYRRILMREFGPPHRPSLVSDMETDIRDEAHSLIDALADKKEADLVANFAYQLPLAMIMKLLDIPSSDESKFHEWVSVVAGSTGGNENSPESKEAFASIGKYLGGVANERRGKAGTDMISGLVNDEGPDGRLPDEMVAPMAALVLIAGHETTVNLIANGILTLLQTPEEITRVRQDRTRIIKVFEELMRLQPPVQLLQNRSTLTDVEVGGVTIPANSSIVLVVAAANRDPLQFPDPDRFDPDRSDNRHLGFGSGIHSCFGAALARLEGQVALQTLFDRLVRPRLLDPNPPYRPSPLLRGPAELKVGFERVLSQQDAR